MILKGEARVEDDPQIGKGRLGTERCQGSIDYNGLSSGSAKTDQVGLGWAKRHPILIGSFKDARDNLIDLSTELRKVILVVLDADQEVICPNKLDREAKVT